MSCSTNMPSINKTFIVEAPESGSTITSACTVFYTNQLTSCSGDTVIVLASGFTEFNNTIIPSVTDSIDLGTPIRRFRNINTVSGTSTTWTSTNEVITPNLNLGLDSDNNLRIITADNSIIQNDLLNGGTY